MNRRTLLRMIGAACVAPFVPRPKAPVQFSVPMNWSRHEVQVLARFDADKDKAEMVRRLMQRALDEHDRLLSEALFRCEHWERAEACRDAAKALRALAAAQETKTA